MARYRDEFEDERDYRRGGSFERDRPWNYNRPFSTREEDYRQRDFGRERFSGGRFGERADYQHDEPRYSGSAGGYRDVEYERSGMDRDYGRAYDEQYGASRSRLRCREIMTRDLAVATRDTALSQIASMMKDEDTGVIPVVDFESNGGDGSAGFAGERRAIGNSYSYGRLIGLVTDRDIAIRAVAEDKDCRAARAEEVMSTDLYTAKPNDRMVDVLRKMGDKQVRRIPVVSENGSLRGMISLGDIALETDADRELADALEDISKKSGFWGRIFS